MHNSRNRGAGYQSSALGRQQQRQGWGLGTPQQNRRRNSQDQGESAYSSGTTGISRSTNGATSRVYSTYTGVRGSQLGGSRKPTPNSNSSYGYGSGNVSSQWERHEQISSRHGKRRSHFGEGVNFDNLDNPSATSSSFVSSRLNSAGNGLYHGGSAQSFRTRNTASRGPRMAGPQALAGEFSPPSDDRNGGGSDDEENDNSSTEDVFIGNKELYNTNSSIKTAGSGGPGAPANNMLFNKSKNNGLRPGNAASSALSSLASAYDADLLSLVPGTAPHPNSAERNRSRRHEFSKALQVNETGDVLMKQHGGGAGGGAAAQASSTSAAGYNSNSSGGAAPGSGLSVGASNGNISNALRYEPYRQPLHAAKQANNYTGASGSQGGQQNSAGSSSSSSGVGSSSRFMSCNKVGGAVSNSNARTSGKQQDQGASAGQVGNTSSMSSTSGSSSKLTSTSGAGYNSSTSSSSTGLPTSKRYGGVVGSSGSKQSQSSPLSNQQTTTGVGGSSLGHAAHPSSQKTSPLEKSANAQPTPQGGGPCSGTTLGSPDTSLLQQRPIGTAPSQFSSSSSSSADPTMAFYSSKESAGAHGSKSSTGMDHRGGHLHHQNAGSGSSVSAANYSSSSSGQGGQMPGAAGATSSGSSRKHSAGHRKNKSSENFFKETLNPTEVFPSAGGTASASSSSTTVGESVSVENKNNSSSCNTTSSSSAGTGFQIAVEADTASKSTASSTAEHNFTHDPYTTSSPVEQNFEEMERVFIQDPTTQNYYTNGGPSSASQAERPRSAPKTGGGRPRSAPKMGDRDAQRPPSRGSSARPERGSAGFGLMDIGAEETAFGAQASTSAGTLSRPTSSHGGHAGAAGLHHSGSAAGGEQIDRVAMIEAAFRERYYRREERPESRKGSRNRGIDQDGLLPTGPDDADVIQSIESTDLSYQNAKTAHGIAAAENNEVGGKRMKRPPSRKKDPSASAAQGLGGAVTSNKHQPDDATSNRPGFAVGNRLGKRPPSRHKEPPQALHLEFEFQDCSVEETIDLPSSKTIQRSDSAAALRTTCRWAQAVEDENELETSDIASDFEKPPKPMPSALGLGEEETFLGESKKNQWAAATTTGWLQRQPGTANTSAAADNAASGLGDCTGEVPTKSKQRPQSSSAGLSRHVNRESKGSLAMQVEDVDVDNVPTIVCTKPRPQSSSSNRRLPFHTSLDHDFLDLFAS
ncbi:unnamed protein product [Amoebophrya sp. A120]|nr:unnamed protein product [Amoebophrya sp. A120]|eukprot:GSA120T00022664001.1